jgi:cytochrome oxidase Cu insertion factor (SCO1/SenC/PrrC family)
MPIRGGDYAVNHPTTVFLMDKDGRNVEWFNYRAANAAAEVRKYL